MEAVLERHWRFDLLVPCARRLCLIFKVTGNAPRFLFHTLLHFTRVPSEQFMTSRARQTDDISSSKLIRPVL